MTLSKAKFSLLLVAGSMLAAACSSEPRGTHDAGSGSPQVGTTGSGAPAEGQGTIGLQLQLAPGISINSVQYAITNPTLAGFATLTGSVDVSGSNTVSFALSLPVGTGYRLSLSAIDSAGDPCNAGPVNFTVQVGQSTAVGLTLLCTRTVDGGLFGPDVNVAPVVIEADASLQTTTSGGGPCAAATMLLAAPAQTGIGSTISLSGAGIDPNQQSSDVTLTWSASGSAGTLSSTTGASTTLTCNTDGAVTVTLTASITGGASCPGIGSLSETVTCGALPDAAAETGAPDATSDAPEDTAVVDSSPAETGAESSTPDAQPEAGATETGAAETGAAEAGADVASGPVLPCVGSGDAPNCVQCDHSKLGGGVCTQTEAIAVKHDIAKGLFTGNLPDANTSATPSCYECLVAKHAVDYVASVTKECDDLTGTAVTQCLNTFTCILGGGTAAASATFVADSTGAVSSCVGAPPSNDGYVNCFCGSAEPDTGDCSSAQSIAANNTTGGLGVASPNGVCDEVILAGLGGDGDSTPPGTIVTDMTTNTLPSGKALAILGAAGSQSATPSCPQCWQ